MLKPSRSGREFGHKGLSESESEERLDKLLRVRGEDGLNKLRNEARALREDLNTEDEFRRLDVMIGALLRTRDTPLSSPAGKARARSPCPTKA